MARIRSALETISASPNSASFRLSMRRPKGVHIDMTPMVDVAFLLVIFFMVTALFTKPHIMNLDVPPPGRSVELSAESILSVKVREDGRVFWQAGFGALSEVRGEEELAALLSAHARADEELALVVKVDPASPYKKMIDVLDVAQAAKIHRVTALTLEGAERDEINAIAL